MQGSMHAFLIIGNDSEAIKRECTSRIADWKISNWDTISIPQEGTVGIDMIRDFQRELSLTPRNSSYRAGIFYDIDRATPEAQNALLKTLEEPPPNTYIIGTTNNPEALLPTIRSRMSIVRLTEASQKPDTTLLLKLMNASPGTRLSILDPFLSTREDAKKFVSDLLVAAHQELCTHPSEKLTTLVRNLLTAQPQLSVNVTPKLVLDNAILHFT